MSANPFKVQGGVVSRETQMQYEDNSSLMTYNMIMNRYYQVGRDCKGGLISKDTAKFQFEDIIIQLGMLRLNQSTAPALRISIDSLTNRVKNTLSHLDEIESILL